MKINGIALAEAIDQTTRAVGACPLVNVRHSGKKLYVCQISDKDKGAAQFVVETGEKGEFSFQCSTDSLRNACAGRKDLNIEIVDGKLVVSKGNYRGELPTNPYKDFRFDSTKEKRDLTKGVGELVIQAYDAMGIKNIHEERALELVTVPGEKKSLIFIADNYHMVLLEVKAKLPKLHIPQSYFDTALRLFKGKKFQLAFGENSIQVVGEDLIIQLPMVETVRISPVEIQKLLDRKPYVTYVTKTEALSNVMDNLYAVFDPDRGIAASIKGGKMRFRYETEHGVIQDSINVQGDKEATALINIQHFADVLRLAEKEVKMGFYKDGNGATNILGLTCVHPVGKVHYFVLCSAVSKSGKK